MAFHSTGTNNWDIKDSKNWYHGSPFKLEVLKIGSSITRNMDIARAFSHQPTKVWSGDDGIIKHNGKSPGFLYIIDEPVTKEDLKVHKACRPDDPWEWLTNKEFKVRLIAQT